MTTPKEKAEELVERYFPVLSDSIHSHIINESRKRIAIKHAIITCEQVIEELQSRFDKGLKNVYMSLNTPKQTHRDVINPEIKYWQEVKNELQKM